MRSPVIGPDDVTQVGRLPRPGKGQDTLIDTGVDLPAIVDPVVDPVVADGVDDGVRALLAFHDEIRRQLVLLDGIARGHVVDDDAIAAMRAFLTGPLTWHDEDEEVTLLARLRRRRVWSVQLTHVTAGHEKLEDLLDRIVPLLDALPASRGALTDDATRLRSLLTGHLHLEEEYLFPLVRRTFDKDALIEMGAEIESRHERRRGKASATPTSPSPPPSPPPSTSIEATVVTPAPPADLVATRFRVVTASPPPGATAAKTPATTKKAPTPTPRGDRARPLPATASVSLGSMSGSAVDDD